MCACLDSMEVDDTASSTKLLRIYSSVHQTLYAHTPTSSRTTTTDAQALEGHVVSASLPFLRCAAILFRHITQVPEPAALHGMRVLKSLLIRTVSASFTYPHVYVYLYYTCIIIYIYIYNICNLYVLSVCIICMYYSALCSPVEEYSVLTKYLALPASPAELFTDDILLRVIHLRLSDACIRQRAATAPTESLLQPLVDHPLQVNQLVPLPHDYSDLINSASKFPSVSPSYLISTACAALLYAVCCNFGKYQYLFVKSGIIACNMKHSVYANKQDMQHDVIFYHILSRLIVFFLHFVPTAARTRTREMTRHVAPPSV